jgi:hypothetical protein
MNAMTMILKNGKIFLAGLAENFSQELVTREGVSHSLKYAEEETEIEREVADQKPQEYAASAHTTPAACNSDKLQTLDSFIAVI